ncbi:DNA mismatch repair endonuclease MutL [uncultured Anaerococcus sp.]|uniref:DNA mismatch repair endonuclease MutL n=1 Tax=uncultured Anaerococcus sp. TaxID=293428 RepID=UPI0026043DBA|nr:DNA mismatch repair endonuclease MutL [uncultured Anaerococcus sp.]
MPIVKLDAYTIEQIAAGEVIESPVSVVKELVENSIDAGSKNIVVEIKNGGKTYIRVTDDGGGIASDDIRLAFEKHATSKIRNFSDLYDVYSLGFRGEALASIVSVSNLVAISKTDEEEVGKKIEFKNNKANISSIATNKGTSIIVSDLFSNLPVRKKFLKTDIAETNAVSKLMYSLAIGYKNIAFKYIKDNRIEFTTYANDPLDLKISNLLDSNLKDNLIEISSRNQVYELDGFISSPNYYRGSRTLQYIYVNNRLIDSSLIVNTIEKEYRSLIPNGRFPAFVIFINTNPKNLDINVHPNKRIIKFNYEDELIDLIEKGIRKLLKDDSKPSEIIINKKEKKELPDLSNYQSLLDSYKSFDIVKEENTSYESNDFFDENKEIDIFEEYSFINKNDKKDISNEKLVSNKPSYLYLASIFNRYSIFKKSRNEIMIMDHRRADEAIKFNIFIEQMQDKSIDSQLLLKPIIINLKANDKEIFDQKKDFILNLGFDINQIGENQIIIRSVPQLFDIPENESFFYDILDLDFNNKNEIFYKSIIKYIRANAFRKGHKIGETEAIQLLNELFTLDNPYKSYDGKSTILIVDDDSLEHFFER